MRETIHEKVEIPAPRGRLAGEMAYPLGAVSAAALIVNPHPHMGGRMNNPLIAAIAEGLAKAGFVSLRFDYAGVGDSAGAANDVAESMEQFWATGRAPEDPLLADDAHAAFDWLRSKVDRPMVLVGYSFGAFVATRLFAEAGDAAVHAIALITPTIDHHDFASFRNVDLPTLVVHSDNDFATGENRTQQWIDSLPGPTSVRVFKGADHFFRRREAAVATACAEFLLGTLHVAPGARLP